MYPISLKANKNYTIPPRIYNSEGFRSTCHYWIDAKTLAIGYENGQVKFFALKETEAVSTVNLTKDGYLEPVSMHLSNDKNLLAVGRTDGKVSILLVSNLEKPRILHNLVVDESESSQPKTEEDMSDSPSGPQSVENVQFQPDSNKILLACSCMNGNIVIFEMRSNQQFYKRRTISNNGHGITKMLWFAVEEKTSSNLGGPRLLVSGDIRGKIQIWDGAGGEHVPIEKSEETEEDQPAQLPEFCISELHGHEASIMDLKIVKSCILSSSEDGTCKLFDLTG